MSIHTVSPRFVGRATELGALGRALARARAGSASTVLVGGEAGVGKTRLIKEFAERIGDVRELVGHCLELGTDGLPFAPFTAVLRRLVRDLGQDGVAALVPGGSTRGLARLLPDFGEPEGDGAEARARLFEQVLGLLENLAEQQPVLMVIEDAHWADRSTRDLLSFLVRYQRTDVPLLIVVTYRTDELHRTHPLRPLLAELGRVDWVTRLELGRLTRREVVAQAASILEHEPSPVIIDEIYARSEGNPLFVEALLSEGGGDELPESLRDLLLASVERLPEETQDLMRVASAGGQRIEHELLLAVTGLDDGALSRSLRPAVAGNVLVVDGEGYAFRHALIREALHDDLLPGEHARLHTRFAEALERDLAILPAPRGAIELAHHWHAAHDATWALVSAWRAAAAARKSTAYDEQLRMLSRVLELWDNVPDAAERIEADRIGVLHSAAAVAFNAGEYDRGISLTTAALEEIDRVADPVRTARLLRLRGLLRYDMSRKGHLEDLQEAATLVPADPPTNLRAQIAETLARMCNTRDRWPDKIRNAEEAVAIARAVGDRATEANALTTLAWGRFNFGDVEGGLPRFAEAREIAVADKAYGALMRHAISLSDALEGAGWHEEAVKVAERGIADAEEYGLARTSGTFLAINLAEPLVSLGRWDEALEVIERALDLAPPPIYRASLEGFVGDIALWRGDLERAQAMYAAQNSVLKRTIYRDQHMLPSAAREIELLTAGGRLEEAAEAALRALREQDLAASPRYSWPVLVGSALLGGQVLEEARAQARWMRAEGVLQEAERLTFNAIAGPADDLDAWDAAAQAWSGLRQPYREARALVGAARAAHAGGARKEAAERVARARELAGRVGARPLLEELDSFARRARLAVGEEPEPQAPQLGLTARELEVLRHLTDGKSNREIGGELFISVKTVSVHVSNILAKLGVASRGEAAATAHRLGLFESAG